MENLPSYLSDNPLKPGSILASTCAMEVSAEFTRFALERMYRSLDAPTHNAIIDLPRRERRIVFIHMGVNSCATKFQLEVQGRNEATFSCPDERGWTPIKQPIDRNNSDLSTVYRTTLCLEPLVDLLTQRGFGVELSINAGRFVCNWVYFNSLQLAEQADAYSLFVHVPPASVVPVDRQVQFMAALLDCVARIH